MQTPKSYLDTYKLKNGVSIPCMGFGTYMYGVDHETSVDCIRHAAQIGYRLFDTASLYMNEQGVGEALRTSGVPRKELFVSSKVWNQDQGYDATMASFHESLEDLQMGLWLNMFLLPLESDKENTGYCIYSYDVTPDADSEQRVSLSADTSAAVLKTCLKLRGSEDIHKKFNEVISDIRRICDSDECCILLIDRPSHTCTVLCEAVRPDSEVPSIYTAIEDGFFEITETWDDTVGDSTCIIINNPVDMEWLGSVNPIWHDSLVESKVSSIVFFPLDYNNERIGYIWASNFNTENAFKIKEILELATFFIASEIANFQLLSKLEIMGSHDLLTGVMNRNEMNDYVERLSEGNCSGSVGVIFADVNGLKVANDTKGHLAGDTLLINIASALRNVFHLNEIFRAGGDEFVVILTCVTEDELQGKIELLRKEAENYPGLSFAVGTAYDESTANIRSALHIADEQMYLDKKRYHILNMQNI